MTYHPHDFMNPEILAQIRELDRRTPDEDSQGERRPTPALDFDEIEKTESLAVRQYEATLAVVDAARRVRRTWQSAGPIVGLNVLAERLDFLDKLEGQASS